MGIGALDLLELLERLQRWAATVADHHGVDPYVYLALTTACAPVFYYSIYRVTRAVAHRQAPAINAWSAALLGATVVPYVYVLVFGRALPWWIYFVLGVLLVPLALALLPALLLLMAADFATPKTQGNGLLILAEKALGRIAILNGTGVLQYAPTTGSPGARRSRRCGGRG